MNPAAELNALKLAQERLQEAQRIANLGSWSLDLVSGELLWSDQIYRIFELDPQAFQPSYAAFLELVHPEDRELVDQAYSRSLDTREPYEVIHRLLMPDGRIKVVRERCETRFSPSGAPLLSQGTAQDITARVEQSQALEANERRLRALFELSPYAIALSDGAGRVLDCNPALLQLTGLPRQALQERGLDQLLDGEPSPGSLVDRPLYGPERRQLRTGEGQPVEVLCSAVMNRGERNEQEFWWIFEDLTESLRIRAQLEQAAQVFRHANEGIMVTAADGAILDVNGALCRITGYGREELIGANPRLFKSGEHDQDFYARLWTQLLEQGAWNGEIVNRAKDGELIPMLATISALRDGQGDIARFVTLLTDIREQKGQQRRLEALALYDPLTGLPNRALLIDRLERALERSQRDGTGLAVGFLDLDGFKQVNDLYGHQAGDELLRVLAERMQPLLRAGDTLARLGGDEFVLVLPGISTAEQVRGVGERLLALIAEPVTCAGHRVAVSGSLGITLHPDDEPEAGAEQLMRHADLAMYAAKQQGRNGLAWFREVAS